MLLIKKSLYLSAFFWVSFFIFLKQIVAAPSTGLVNEGFILEMTPRIDALLANTETILEKNLNHPGELFNMIKEYAQLLNNFREYLAIRNASPNGHYHYVYLNFLPIFNQTKSIKLLNGNLEKFKKHNLSEELKLDPAFLDSLSLFTSYLLDHFKLYRCDNLVMYMMAHTLETSPPN